MKIRYLDGGRLYRAREKPVEGTIVSVMRETAEEAQQSRFADFAELLEHLLARARTALARTPDLLPVLRTAGVVDAGAKGFVHIL
ncbi:MAG: DAK2 domain-containing protein [Gemmatimonadota bacterium]